MSWSGMRKGELPTGVDPQTIEKTTMQIIQIGCISILENNGLNMI